MVVSPSNSSTVGSRSTTQRKQRRYSRRHSIVAPAHKTHGYLNGYLKKRVVAFALDSMIAQQQESIPSKKHQSVDLGLNGMPCFQEAGGPTRSSHDVQSTLKRLMSSPSKIPVDTEPYTLVRLGSHKDMESHKFPDARVLAKEHEEYGPESH